MRTCYKCKENKNIDKFGNHCWCKDCVNINKRESRKTKEGLASYIYTVQVQSSKKRKMDLPSYNREWIIGWLLSQKLFHELYSKWAESGYKKELKPSVDRMNDYDSYNINNIKLMTWEENDKKAHVDIISGINNKISKAVVQLTKNDIFVAEYYSQMEAQRRTGVLQSNITKVCNNVHKSAGGFKWKFKGEIR